MGKIGIIILKENNIGLAYVYKLFVDGPIIYAATRFCGITYSLDYGKHWRNITTKNGLIDNEVNDVFVKGPVIYAATNWFSYSNDSGKSWVNYTTKNGLGSNKIAGIFIGNRTIYLATNSGIFLSFLVISLLFLFIVTDIPPPFVAK